jgi:hypothetical protein
MRGSCGVLACRHPTLVRLNVKVSGEGSSRVLGETRKSDEEIFAPLNFIFGIRLGGRERVEDDPHFHLLSWGVRVTRKFVLPARDKLMQFASEKRIRCN